MLYSIASLSPLTLQSISSYYTYRSILVYRPPYTKQQALKSPSRIVYPQLLLSTFYSISQAIILSKILSRLYILIIIISISSFYSRSAIIQSLQSTFSQVLYTQVLLIRKYTYTITLPIQTIQQGGGLYIALVLRFYTSSYSTIILYSFIKRYLKSIQYTLPFIFLQLYQSILFIQRLGIILSLIYTLRLLLSSQELEPRLATIYPSNSDRSQSTLLPYQQVRP